MPGGYAKFLVLYSLRQKSKSKTIEISNFLAAPSGPPGGVRGGIGPTPPCVIGEQSPWEGVGGGLRLPLVPLPGGAVRGFPLHVTRLPPGGVRGGPG